MPELVGRGLKDFGDQRLLKRATSEDPRVHLLSRESRIVGPTRSDDAHHGVHPKPVDLSPMADEIRALLIRCCGRQRTVDCRSAAVFKNPATVRRGLARVGDQDAGLGVIGDSELRLLLDPGQVIGSK